MLRIPCYEMCKELLHPPRTFRFIAVARLGLWPMSECFRFQRKLGQRSVLVQLQWQRVYPQPAVAQQLEWLQHRLGRRYTGEQWCRLEQSDPHFTRLC